MTPSSSISRLSITSRHLLIIIKIIHFTDSYFLSKVFDVVFSLISLVLAGVYVMVLVDPFYSIFLLRFLKYFGILPIVVKI